MTIQQLSADLNVNESTIRSWIRRGTAPPHYKLNNLVRFKQHEVDEWVDKHRVVRRPRKKRTPKVVAHQYDLDGQEHPVDRHGRVVKEDTE